MVSCSREALAPLARVPGHHLKTESMVWWVMPIPFSGVVHSVYVQKNAIELLAQDFATINIL